MSLLDLVKENDLEEKRDDGEMRSEVSVFVPILASGGFKN